MKTFNFGESFIRWFKTLYKNANSCIINNGYTSESSSINRGVRKGDTSSGSLLVLAVQLLAHTLRTNKNIKAIAIKDKKILLTQYADDTTIFIEDIQSTETVLKTIELFGKMSGLKLNKRKCEELWLGKDKHNKSQLFGISWPENPINALGVHFSYCNDEIDNYNLSNNLESMEKLY